MLVGSFDGGGVVGSASIASSTSEPVAFLPSVRRKTSGILKTRCFVASHRCFAPSRVRSIKLGPSGSFSGRGDAGWLPVVP